MSMGSRIHRVSTLYLKDISHIEKGLYSEMFLSRTKSGHHRSRDSFLPSPEIGG
jgi:hypothetical protein